MAVGKNGKKPPESSFTSNGDQNDHNLKHCLTLLTMLKLSVCGVTKLMSVW